MVCFHTGTPSSAPTIGGANEGNGNFYLSWSLGVKIGSVAGVVVIAVFIVCLVCLVVLGLVLYHSKKRRKEFETGKNVPITIY